MKGFNRAWFKLVKHESEDSLHLKTVGFIFPYR
jgi:hypothetical protein